MNFFFAAALTVLATCFTFMLCRKAEDEVPPTTTTSSSQEQHQQQDSLTPTTTTTTTSQEQEKQQQDSSLVQHQQREEEQSSTKAPSKELDKPISLPTNDAISCRSIMNHLNFPDSTTSPPLSASKSPSKWKCSEHECYVLPFDSKCALGKRNKRKRQKNRMRKPDPEDESSRNTSAIGLPPQKKARNDHGKTKKRKMQQNELHVPPESEADASSKTPLVNPPPPKKARMTSQLSNINKLEEQPPEDLESIVIPLLYPVPSPRTCPSLWTIRPISKPSLEEYKLILKWSLEEEETWVHFHMLNRDTSRFVNRPVVVFDLTGEEPVVTVDLTSDDEE